MVSHISNSSTQRVKTVDCGFDHRLGYIVNSWIIQAALPDPIFKKKKNQTWKWMKRNQMLRDTVYTTYSKASKKLHVQLEITAVTAVG